MRGFGFGIALSSVIYLSAFTVFVANDQQQAALAAGADGVHTSGPYVTSEDRIADYTWWLSAFTLALVVVSAVQIGFLIRADKTARLSADAAKASADALPKTERAFVFCQNIPEMTILDERKIPTTFIYRPEWRNSGTTPTKRMTVRTNWAKHRGDLPNDFAYDYSGSPEVMFLGPQAVMFSNPVHISADNLVAAAKDETRIYIWGRVDYTDMFGADHYSQFCYRLRAETVPDNSYGMRHRTYYGPYNRTDESDT